MPPVGAAHRLRDSPRRAGPRPRTSAVCALRTPGSGRSVHEWIDHTSELELRVHAGSAGGVVEGATKALGELLGEPEGPPTLRALAVAAPDPAGLLAAWLEELVFLAEDEALLAGGASRVELAADALRGEVLVRPGRPSYLVKAVTYHRLALEPDDAGWRGNVVLDV